MQVTYLAIPYAELRVPELYELLRLRAEVFVVEQNCVYQDLDEKDQHGLHVLGLNYDGRLAAYTRLLPKGISYPNYASIGRVVTAPFARGKGIGRPLMEASIRELFAAWGEQPIKISAQAHLQGYYGSLGFETVTEEYMEDGIPHVGMRFLP